MKIDFHETLKKVGEVGFVERAISSLVYVEGLPGAKPGEAVVFESGELGEVTALRESVLEVLSFAKSSFRTGIRVARTERPLEIPVGESLIGALIDPLGHSLDLSKPVPAMHETRPVEVLPPGLGKRVRVQKQFLTGVTMVDLLLPLGHGQRELIMGDQKTGKSRFAKRIMKNQVREGTIGIYALIGKGRTVIRETENILRRMGIRDKVIIVASGADEGAGLTFLTPYSAMTIAEYFRDRGKNVLLVLDDLSIHAKSYREISLLGRRFPGRNAYPGDIFYAHARLMERAGNFVTPQEEVASPDLQSGRGSPPHEAAITCLPIVEAPLGDITGYIQTNTMAMTDGHIFFDHILFAEGRRPAIDPFLSVTRVGRQTQSFLGREVARVLLAFLKEVQAYHNFASFGAELGEHIRLALNKEEQILQLFDETPHDTIPHHLQLFIFGIIWSGLWREKIKADVRGAIDSLILRYDSEEMIRRAIDTFVESCGTLEELLTRVKDFDIAKNTVNPT